MDSASDTASTQGAVTPAGSIPAVENGEKESEGEATEESSSEEARTNKKDLEGRQASSIHITKGPH